MSDLDSAAVPEQNMSSTGQPTRRVARLAYLPVAGFILLVVERSSRLVRFHAAQASIIYVLWTAVALAQPVVAGLLAALGDHSNSSATNASVIVEGWTACGAGLLFIALLIALIVGAFSAGRGRVMRLPVITRLALWLMGRIPSVEPTAGG